MGGKTIITTQVLVLSNNFLDRTSRFIQDVETFHHGGAKVHNLREWTLLGLVQGRSLETGRIVEIRVSGGSFCFGRDTDWKPRLRTVSSAWMARLVSGAEKPGATTKDSRRWLETVPHRAKIDKTISISVACQSDNTQEIYWLITKYPRIKYSSTISSIEIALKLFNQFYCQQKCKNRESYSDDYFNSKHYSSEEHSNLLDILLYLD